MRVAVVSDLHSNLAALEEVAGALREDAPDVVVCLGDLVGYNAEPAETVDLARSLTTRFVLGNHDRDAARASALPGTHASARKVQTWTYERLSPDHRAFLESLPVLLVEPGEYVAAHGCYLNDTHYNGYVTSTMLEANLTRIAAREDWPALAFCGHTHAAMCGWLHKGAVSEAPPTGTVPWPRGAEAVLVNPGAVGQPRDGDTRAAYALVDTRTCAATFRRIAYDVERTIARALTAGLPEELAERLREGR